jgi:uncharacterized protein (DUF924 family)
MERSEQILAYWFGTDDEPRNRSNLWFGQSDATDTEIRQMFGRDLELATEGRLDEWAATARGRLALILVLDQFSRHIHRDQPAAHARDRQAQALCIEGITRGIDRRLAPLERWFFYMPLMHAEDLDLQARSVHCFRQLVEDATDPYREPCQGAYDHAKQHRDLVERFGRFPERNELLGRASTPEELRYLERRKRSR